MIDRVTAALAGHYKVLREIGSGGMATVYLAEDLKHHRQVAVKVLRPDLAASLGKERFFREIEVAAKLSHPHILPLHDSGEADGFLYYVMPFVEGTSLRDKLGGGELPVHDVVRILEEVADALAYAHARGVVHRDIKPDNVMITGRHALVMDFGVAKAVSEATGRQSITTIGVALGTPAYMAPEQAAAEEHIDQRVDIYALGAMAYELLTGRPPFTGMTAQQVLAAHVTQAPVPVTERRASCPPALAAVVMKCLEKRPADRWQNAEELMRQFDQLVTPSGGMTPTSAVPATAARAPAPAPAPAIPHRWHRGAYLALGILLTLGLAFGAMRLRGNRAAATNANRIAVLPFENLGDSSRLYFANGVTEAITTQLTGIGGLSVIPRATAARYRGTSKTITEIGQELGVGYVLTGTVQWEEVPGKEPKVRVSPELVRVSDTSSVWAHGYDAVLTSVFQVYSDVSTQVAGALQVALDDPEKENLARRPTENAEAYDLYLRAVDLSNRGLAKENFDASIPMLQRAVALDPKFALAWGRLAEQLGLAHWLYIRRTDQTIADAQAAAETALRLQPDLPEAHRAMGNVWYRKREYAKALREFAIVQRAQPNSADLMNSIGFVERRQGKWDSALVHLQRGRELDPGSAQSISQLGETYEMMGRYDEADALFRQAIEIAPEEPDAYYFQVLSLLERDGNVAGAQRVLREALTRMPPVRFMSGSFFLPALAVAGDDSLAARFLAGSTIESGAEPTLSYQFRSEIHRLRGDLPPARALQDSARVVLERKVREMPDDYGFHVALGFAYARLGMADAAIREGTRAVDLLPPERDAYFGVNNVTNLAEIYAILGQAGPAVEQLRRVQGMPGALSPAYLRVDRTWDPIRNAPEFQRFLAGGH